MKTLQPQVKSVLMKYHAILLGIWFKLFLPVYILGGGGGVWFRLQAGPPSLVWPPSPKLHGCCLSLYTDFLSISVSLLRGSQCSPHGLTNKPSTSYSYCDKPGPSSILLTVPNKFLVLQAFALVLILKSVFQWHCQFQQNCLFCWRRPDCYTVCRVCCFWLLSLEGTPFFA